MVDCSSMVGGAVRTPNGERKKVVDGTRKA